MGTRLCRACPHGVLYIGVINDLVHCVSKHRINSFKGLTKPHDLNTADLQSAVEKLLTLPSSITPDRHINSFSSSFTEGFPAMSEENATAVPDRNTARDPKKDEKISRSVSGPVMISSNGDKKEFFQYVYKTITEKNESISKTIRLYKITRRDDIKSICERLRQVAKQYNCTADSIKITVELVDDTTHKFNDIDNFINSDTTSNCNTDSITIEYSFFIVNEDKKNAEYKILIHIESVDYLTEDRQHRVLNEIMSPAPFYSSVNFTDYMISKYILSIIDEWVAGLDDAKVNRFFEFFKNYYPPYSLSMLPKRIIFIIAAAPSLVALWINLRTLSNGLDQKFVDTVMYYILFTIAAVKSTEIIHAIFASAIMTYRPPTFILYNRGDEKNIENYTTKHQGRIKKTTGAAIALAGSIILSLFSAYLEKKIF